MAIHADSPSDPARLGHPIAVVAERTGLSRDVLRAWERRYGVVEPTRSSGGQRLYSDADLARFRLLADATRYGRTISQVVRLAPDEIARLVAEDALARSVAAGRDSSASDEMAMTLIRALDGTGLDRELRRSIARHGLPVFLEEIAPQLMQRVGDEWQANRMSIAQEHFASSMILAITAEAVRAVPGTPGARCLLVATPAGERHELGAAFAAAAAALDGWTVVQLGADVPAPDVAAAAATTGAHAVAMSVVFTEDPAATERELRLVRAGLPARVGLIVGGAAIAAMPGLRSEAGVFVCDTLAAFRALLARRSAAA